MELSVIIPCLNAEATLSLQLEALASQQWSQPWELIVADNGSIDNSVKIALKYKKHFAAMRVIDAPARKTASHPRNVAARAAISERLAFCDADDEVAPGWVASIGDALASHEIVHGQFRFDKFNEPHQAEMAAKGWKNGLVKKLFLPGGGTGNLGIRRWVHEAIGGFDENLPRFEDADYFWRLQLEGFKLHYLPEAIVQVRMGRVNPSLSSLYRRHRTGAAANYWHYKRYRRFGMLPPQPLKKSLISWLHALRSATSVNVRSKQRSVAWLNRFAQKTGDLVGQIQGRITNPCEPYHPGESNTDNIHRAKPDGTISKNKCATRIS
jgi:glycosyltransferase involved in cell wall biosynthesis